MAMIKPHKSANKKVIIFLITIFFILSNFSAILFVHVSPVAGGAAATVEVGPQIATDVTYHVKRDVRDIMVDIWEDLKAIFFKNVLGNFANMVAKQSAIWVASGGKGETPLFITNFNEYIQGYADAAIGDFIQGAIRDLTGLDVCTLDPRIALSFAFDIPLFPDRQLQEYKPDCSWTDLRNHWEEVGKGELLTFSAQIGAGGEFSENVEQIATLAKGDTTLYTWDAELAPCCLSNCPPLRAGGLVKCAENPLARKLRELATSLENDTNMLDADVKLMSANANADTEVKLRGIDWSGRIVPENINLIKQGWLNKINPKIEEIQKILDVYNRCQNKSGMELIARPERCAVVLSDLAITPPPRQQEIAAEADYLIDIFDDQMRKKMQRAVGLFNSVNGGYQYLKKQIDTRFNPDYFEGSVDQDFKMMRDSFGEDANEFAVYSKMLTEMTRVGINAYANRKLQAEINQGWKAVTDRIADSVRTPSNILRESAQKDINEAGKDTAKSYTKSIAADALGIFLETLWNELVRRLLENLAGGQQEAESRRALSLSLPSDAVPPVNIFNPWEEEIISKQGVRSYVERLASQFTINYTYQKLDLLSEFQLNIKGKINPNIYNNVIDSNFVMAINDKMTIQDAIKSGKLLGNYKFSWGEVPQAGTYHLANIQKLRKARVVPLGLELAVELIRDCNYRFSSGYGDFNDLSNESRFGYDVQADPYKSQKLKNCLFRPFAGDEVEVLSTVRDYNSRKLREVVNATLADVVNGFNRAGAGTCGDFDEDESPFCNLVDPNWVLKLPITSCALQTNLEPYNELLLNNQTGQRYSSCPDFASCLQEDGKGGCVNEDYGFCVKEKNSWQFATDSCPAEFNSCRTYSLTDSKGTRLVSYLKNTLSGNEICGPFNAGCAWYATKSVLGEWRDFAAFDVFECNDPAIGGTWLDGQGCQSERIYLNRYAEICDRSQEGCSEFSFYRDPNVNLVADSNFEYTPEGYFPENWDLRLKKIVSGQEDCVGGRYYEVCADYQYDNQIDCLNNGGIWQDNQCFGAYVNTTEQDCLSNSGQVIRYCTSSILKTNRCQNPQFSGPNAEQQCVINGGAWISECEVEGVVRSELTSEADCSAAPQNGVWNEYCSGAVLYGSDSQANPQTRQDCNQILGSWMGEGPFSDLAYVSKQGVNVYGGLGRLEVNIGGLSAEEELQLIYINSFKDKSKALTKGGDVYTATANLAANSYLYKPVSFNLIKSYLLGDVEANSSEYYVNETYGQASATLVTMSAGTELNILINIPGGQPESVIYVDGVKLSLNSIDQLRTYSFVTQYRDYDLNSKVYYKKPPERLDCNGYGPGDPAPVLPIDPFSSENCRANNNGYWDAELVYKNTVDCYKYKPDSLSCNNFMKICQPEEAGCQLYSPVNGDPNIPGVVSAIDYCPAECVGYETYKQEAVIYEPEPDPLYHYFIPATAISCGFSEVGCSQFTNLDEVARGGEGIEYYTYLRQCIKPGLGLGEKTFFTWRGSASGPPELIKYEFQQDLATGAPKTINGEGDCRLIIGETDLNCVKFFDSNGIEFYRDIRKTISISSDCHPYRKTESNEINCQATNGRWQSDLGACIYDAIPSEGIACSAQSNGCRAFIGNRGNNIYVQFFDNFEGTQLNWYSGISGNEIGLTLVGESIQVGGQSLFVPANINSINRPVDVGVGNLYTLSFWAKASSENERVSIYFAQDGAVLGEFAPVSSQLALSSDWQNYNIGPLLIDWNNIENNRLVIDNIEGAVYFDNIMLKAVKDQVYVVKNSWSTPEICNLNIFGVRDPNNPRPMLGCQAYNDLLGQRHNLKSFTSLCRESAVGCQILIDTKNSRNPASQIFNDENATFLDDYKMEKDELTTFVLNNDYLCSAGNKGCQRFGQPVFEGQQGVSSFQDIYLKNNPDKYSNVPQAIMCDHNALGCTELVNEYGGAEYYKIEPTKLCRYGKAVVSNQNVEGWFKKGSTTLGCATLNYNSVNDCRLAGGEWSVLYDQCVAVLSEISNQESCVLQKGEWLSQGGGRCLANPFTIYKVFEANKYKGYVGECDSRWNGCTEFVDINPNFVANGGFETFTDSRLNNWSSIASQSGSIRQETDDVKVGSKSIKLIKKTEQDCPTTFVSEACQAAPYGIRQQIAQLEKGKTYKISFYYKVPQGAQGRGENCPLPQAAFAFNRKISETLMETSPIYTFDPESDWKKAEILYTVSGLPGLYDFELIIYGPLNNNETKNLPANLNSLNGLNGESSLPIGNCPDSYILYDQIEIKDNTEDSYYVLDVGPNIDRRTCTAVDWSGGCVQFFNTFANNIETIKVKRDRNCEEWAFCSEMDANGVCLQVDLCRENSSGECVQLAYKKDNVRYNLDSQPLIIDRISDYNSRSGYIYRFGSGELSQLNIWRAGDYSGYSIPERYPLEYELEANFKSYQKTADTGTLADRRYEQPICKIFPEEKSPLPYELSQKQEFKDLSAVFSPSTSINSIGNLCSYQEVSAGGIISYFEPARAFSAGTSLCNSGDLKGKIAEGVECVNKSSEIDRIKLVRGLEGMCLEFDVSNPLYKDIYADIYSYCSNSEYLTKEACLAEGAEWIGSVYQPYACLTYYPFNISLDRYK